MKQLDTWMIDTRKALVLVIVFGFSAEVLEGAVVGTPYDERIVSSARNLREGGIASEVIVGPIPKSLVLVGYGAEAYVANYRGRSVSVVDIESKSVVETIAVDENPLGMVWCRRLDLVLVACPGSNTVVALSCKLRRIVWRWKCAGEPWSVALGADERTMAVALYGGTEVILVSLPVLKEIRRVRVGKHPCAVLCSENGRECIVACYHSDEVVVFDMDTAIERRRVRVGQRPCGLELCGIGGPLLVSCFKSSEVCVVERASWSITQRWKEIGFPYRVCCSKTGRSVYVSAVGDSGVYKVEPLTGSVIGRVPLASAPRGMELSADGNRLYVSNCCTNRMTIVDLLRWIPS